MKRQTLRAAILAGAAMLAPLASRAAPLQRADVTDLGTAPAATEIRLALTLAYRNEAELISLVDELADPASPRFRQFLTPEQFADRYGPAAVDYARVAAALQRAGLRITRTYANRTVIDAAGSAEAVAAYFHTPIHLVAQASHGIRYVNASDAVMPAEIADVVHTVLGLDNLVKFRINARRVAVPAGTPDAAPRAKFPVERIVSGSFAGIYPGGTAAAYKFPLLAGHTGTGHGIGVVIDSDIANSDLTTFWTAAGIKRTGTINRVLVNGTNPGVGADVGETAIDVESTSSLAEGANIYIYLISSLSDVDIEDAYNQAVSAHVVDVVSSSFGGCELDDTPFGTATDKIAAQGGAIGITFTASTGDQGGYCYDGKYQEDIVELPASDPHFVAVGGTTLKINPTTGARTSETAWSPGDANGGGGGGVSSFFAKPSYQKNVTGIAVVPKITPPSGNLQPKTGFAGRNLPDISLNASNATGSYIAVYDTTDGGWTGYGGTSVSNPAFAALVATQNQKVGKKAGYLDPGLYTTFTNKGASPAGIYGKDFHDITVGSIGGGWSAKAGYDQATGIGSIFNGAF